MRGGASGAQRQQTENNTPQALLLIQGVSARTTANAGLRVAQNSEGIICKYEERYEEQAVDNPNNPVGSRMKKQWIQRLSAYLLLALGVVFGTSAAAASLDDIFAVAETLNAQAKSSQTKIDALTEETRVLLSEYKTVLKEIQGLSIPEN